MATTSDIKRGLTFKYKNDIYTVVEHQHVKMGRGAAFVRAKIKSLTTGKIIEQRFDTSSRLDDIRVERRNYQYLYNDGDSLVFMETETFEQINFRAEMIDAFDLLQEGQICEVLFNTADEMPLQIEMAQNVIREITYTEPGIRGDTATNTLKPATIDTGAEIRVPLFINIGDKVKIDTTTKAYVERVKS